MREPLPAIGLQFLEHCSNGSFKLFANVETGSDGVAEANHLHKSTKEAYAFSVRVNADEITEERIIIIQLFTLTVGKETRLHLAVDRPDEFSMNHTISGRLIYIQPWPLTLWV